jgi:hypothetical protein
LIQMIRKTAAMEGGGGVGKTILRAQWYEIRDQDVPVASRRH